MRTSRSMMMPNSGMIDGAKSVMCNTHWVLGRCTVVAIMLVMLAGCAGRTPSPQARYEMAVDAKYAGDAVTYFDALLGLAHDQPHSRPGRRARATLMRGQAWTAVWMQTAAVMWRATATGLQLGAESGSSDPGDMDHEEGASQLTRAATDEVTRQLNAIYDAQRQYKAIHKRFAATFNLCGCVPSPDATYTYFLSPKEVAGAGTPAASHPQDQAYRKQIQRFLKEAGVEPHADAKSFVVAAVANLDADDDVDMWIIDEQGNVIQVASDLDN